MIKQVKNPVLEVHDLTVSYARKPVLWGVDFSLPPGKIAGIVGPNGAGKSTLLKSIMNVIPISSGYIRLFDQPLEKVQKRVSYVPQRESVDWDFPASALDVVLMGRYGKLGLFKTPSKEDKAFAKECLGRVGLEAFAKRQISQLSGGQQQRVFLARALAQDADLYLMDEPFAGVDAATERAIIDILRSMAEQNKTIIVVHHDLQSVKRYFDWLILINMRLIASGPTKEVFTETLLEETYGGKLTLLTELSSIMEKQQIDPRERS